MKKLHLALATKDIAACVYDYSKRLGAEPSLVIENEYALWRTESLNISIRLDGTCESGELRHLGWEVPKADNFSSDHDCNGILWEQFTAQQQADEIKDAWPDSDYQP